MKTNRIVWENPRRTGLKDCFTYDFVEDNVRIGSVTINMTTGTFANLDNNELVIW